MSISKNDPSWALLAPQSLGKQPAAWPLTWATRGLARSSKPLKQPSWLHVLKQTFIRNKKVFLTIINKNNITGNKNKTRLGLGVLWFGVMKSFRNSLCATNWVEYAHFAFCRSASLRRTQIISETTLGFIRNHNDLRRACTPFCNLFRHSHESQIPKSAHGVF